MKRRSTALDARSCLAWTALLLAAFLGGCGGIGKRRPVDEADGSLSEDASLVPADGGVDRLAPDLSPLDAGPDAALPRDTAEAPVADRAPNSPVDLAPDTTSDLALSLDQDLAEAHPDATADTAPAPDAPVSPDVPDAPSGVLPDSAGPVLSGAVYVSPGGHDDADGRSPASARRSLAAAIAMLAAGGTIALAEGRYKECLEVRKSLKIYGGYDTSFATRDVARGTVIDAAGLNCRGVLVSIEDSPQEFVLSGVRVENGVGSTFGGDGGGIAVYRAREVLLENCAIVNSAGRTGGGAFLESGTITIRRCTLLGNRAQSSGGGIALYNAASLTLEDSVVQDNRAGSGGGGVAAGSQTTLAIVRTELSGNGADEYGGGVNVWDATARFDSCIFGNNAATRNGGGIAFGPNGRQASYSVRDGTFQGNSPNALYGEYTDLGGNVIK